MLAIIDKEKLMGIRKCTEKDRAAMQNICLETANDYWKTNDDIKEAVVEVFCNYYLDEEADHCFVTTNEADEAVGYILCAPDYETYYKKFTERIGKSKNEITKKVGAQSAEDPKDFAKDYPAHLHIDLLPCAQGHGEGRKLIETLCEHLKSIGVKGVMLDVGADNTGAIAFYKKVGFTVLQENEGGLIMGKETGK